MLTPVPGDTIAAALRRAGERNPLLGIGPPRPDDVGAGRWRGPRAAELAADLVDQVGARLATDQRRVVASMVVLGYAARLLGPAVAVLVRDRIVLDVSAERVALAFVPGAGFRLSAVPPVAGWRGPPPDRYARWHAVVVDDHLEAVVDAVRSVVPVAAGLLWGNVASGLTGALASLVRDGAVPAAAGHRIGRALLDHERLRATGELILDRRGRDGDGASPGAGLRFRRRSCCLYYRLPGGGVCADCCLSAAPAG